MDLEARALATFKEVVDLESDARRLALERIAATDPLLYKEVLQLLTLDAMPDDLLDSLSGGERVLAADIMASIVKSDRRAVEDISTPETIGPYRVVGILGRGGMGVVYEAEQHEPRRRVAIKTVHQWMTSATHRARFAFEMQALASLSHRSIPRLYEVRDEGGALFMVMELIRGEPLFAWAKGRALRTRVELLLEIIDGVAHAHSAGIGHRDLKPGNVLVADGHPRVLDFGLAAPLAPGATSAPAGTLPYMAPEQLVEGPIDQRADIYALGVMLYEMASDRLPLLPSTKLSVARSEKLALAAKPLDDRDLDAVVKKAMAPDPSDRYGSARELAADVRAYLERWPVAARAQTPLYRLERWLARHRTAARAVLVVLTLVALPLVAVLGYRAWDAEHEREAREARAYERLAHLEGELAVLARSDDDARADELFRFFARLPENVGTRALFEAWQHRAERAAPDSEVAIGAWAEAYANALDVAQQVLALRGLARSFEARGDSANLERVVDRLARLDAPLYDVRRSVRAHRRVFDDMPFMARLRGATKLPVAGDRAWLDAGQLYVLEREPSRLHVFERFVECATFDLPGLVRGEVWPGFAAPGTLAGEVVGERRVRLFGLSGCARVTTIGDVPLTKLDAANGWADAQGLHVVAGSAGAERKLVTHTAHGTWERSTSADTRPSDVDGIVASDLDGDGTREVAVAFGAWASYTLKVFRENATGGLDERASLVVGAISAMTAMPDGLVIMKSQRYPSPDVLGAETPFGWPPGLYRVRFDGTALAPGPVTTLPAPYGSIGLARRMFSGDFDGDGMIDLAFSADAPTAARGLLLYPGDGSAPIVIDEVTLLAVGNADDDPLDELLVQVDGNIWVMGAGDDRLPILAAPSIPSPSIEGLPADPALARAWSAATDLASMGLGARAAATLSEAAELSADRREGARLLVRAGDLRMAADDAIGATSSFTSALRLDPTSVSARRGAAEGHLAAHDVDGALVHFRALDDAASRARVAWLEPLVRHEPPRVVIDRTTLDPAWQILEDFALSRTTEGGQAIAFDAFNDTEATAILPVHYDGGRLAFAIEGLVTRLEMGSGVQLFLRKVGGPPLLPLELSGSGGGRAVERTAGCGLATSAILPFLHYDRKSTTEVEAARLSIDVLPLGDAVEVRCSASAGAQSLARRYPMPPLAPGDYELVLAPMGPRDEALLWCRFLVTQVTIEGLVPRTLAPTDAMKTQRARFESDPSVVDTKPAPESWLVKSNRDRWLRKAPRAALDELAALTPEQRAQVIARVWQVAVRYRDDGPTQELLLSPVVATLPPTTPEATMLLERRAQLLRELRGD